MTPFHEIGKEINHLLNFFLILLTRFCKLNSLGHPELITLSHDGQDLIERLIYWDTDAQNKQISFLNSIDTFLNESTKYLKSPAKLAKFLASHKALIDAKKPF